MRKNTKLPMDRKSVELRYQRFVKEYMTNGFNGDKAAVSAGYVEEDARKQAFVLLAREEVQRLMQEFQNEATKDLDSAYAKIIKEQEALAYHDAADIFNDWTDLKKFDELTRIQKKCISEIDTKVVTDKNGNKNEYVRIKFHDKGNALKELGKLTGAYELDNSQKNVQSVNIIISNPDLADQLESE